MSLNRLSATEALAAMGADEISSEALVRACLQRIDEREQDVRAWAALDREGALAAAREADRIRRNGAGRDRLLLGIPFGVKDNIATTGLPTAYNSPIYRGHHSGSDAPAVELLRNAGAILLGKTETVEFAAHGRPAPTRNPRDLSRTPSGSSSGSAAAVADYMVPFALGTQTGGSVIRPASYCGCIGFKPTYGTVSTEGIKLISVSLDTIGWFARSMADIALLADALEIADEWDPAPRAVEALKIGVYRTHFWDRALPAARGALEEAAQRLTAAGAAVEDCEWSAEFAELNLLQEKIMSGEGFFAFLNLFRAHSGELSASIHKRIVRVPAEELLAAGNTAAALRPRFDQLACAYDAILTLAAPGEAPVGLNAPAEPIFNSMWTLLHVPCIVLPGITGPIGMPVGVQLVASRGADASLLATAAAIAPLLLQTEGPFAPQT
jgi:Asp-tRNA(Asn)/Glu-tRNA(Gln) amidotransferase A subunit family amidase